MSDAREEPIDPALVESLRGKDAYPGDASASAGVTLIETHLNQVFLSGERAYKVRKAVDVGFVSFLTQTSRNADCLREVSLNRRLSPDVYLGLAPIQPRAKGFAVGPIDPNPGALAPVEHCVVMRRLPEGRDASTLVDAELLRPEHLDRVARRIARFHARHGLGRPSPFTAAAWRERIFAPVADNCDSLIASSCPAVASGEVDTLRTRAHAAFERLLPRFEARRAAGRAVDAHGDLHLQHVWFETDDAEPLIIDCLEFSDELRRIDTASEVAFLAMDLAFRGRPDLGERLLARYAAETDDYDLYSVVDFFVSYRAAVRGKVEAITSRDPRISAAQRDASAALAAQRVAFAIRALEVRPPGAVFLVGGIIGSGKSTVARALAEACGAVVIASDEVRQRIDRDARGSGRKEESQEGWHTGWQAGRYAPDATARVYEEVLARAAPVVTSGRSVILDASFAHLHRRERARQFAAQRGAKVVFIEARCEREEALARLERRQREGNDASEAGPGIYDAFVATFEPVSPDEWAPGCHRVIRTDDPDWRKQLAEL